MKRKITAILMTFVMVFSVMGASTTMVQAATTPFMSVVSGPVKEKVGNYYIWVKTYRNEEGQPVKEELRVATKANGKGTVLKTVTGTAFIPKVISNGQTIYYSVVDWDKEQMKIFKTTAAGKKNILFRTVNNVEAKCGPLTVYNGRLYYDRDCPDKDGYRSGKIYSVDLNNKNCRLEKNGVLGQSGYGRYITCDNEYKDMNSQLYNVKTKKTKPLVKSIYSRVYNGNIYFAMWNDNGAFVKKTNLEGKNLVTLGKVKGAYWNVSYLGKTMAYFENWDNGAQKKLTYSTKKIVNVK